MVQSRVGFSTHSYPRPYPSYIYNYNQEPSLAPQAYLPQQTISETDLEIEFSSLRDIFICDNYQVYIVDDSRIIVFNDDWEILHSIDSFKK